jgi:pyruvate/2-oxoglutarate dehydrogenase complex dihydrolipoamide dehydrogenase (E3) component
VLPAEEAYVHPEKAGQKVAILGGGLGGIELGLYLAILGRDVTVIEMLGNISDGGNFLHVLGLKVEMKKQKLDLNLNTKAKEITEKGVLCQTPDGEKFFEADTVVYAVGQSPLLEEASALRFCAPEFYQIGDCVTPKNIVGGFTVARDLGHF